MYSYQENPTDPEDMQCDKLERDKARYVGYFSLDKKVNCAQDTNRSYYKIRGQRDVDSRQLLNEHARVRANVRLRLVSDWRKVVVLIKDTHFYNLLII